MNPRSFLTVTLSLFTLSALLPCASASGVVWGDSTELVERTMASPRVARAGEIPFDLETPLTPWSDYAGAPIFGGVVATGEGGLTGGAQIMNNNPYNAGGNDVFLFGRAADRARAGDTVTGVFLWRLEDGEGRLGELSFNGRVNGNAPGATARFVVWTGERFLVSGDVGLPVRYESRPVTVKSDELTWHAYDPEKDMAGIGAAVPTPDLSGLKAVGLHLSATHGGGGALNLAFSSFVARVEGGPVVMAYYPTYRQSSNLPISHVPWSDLTHVVHSFAKVDEDGKLEAPTELLPSRELTREGRKRGVRVLLALGGGANGKAFTAMARDLQKRNAFVREVAAWVRDYGYDGVVLDWEFPEEEDKQRLVNFLYGLRSQMPAGADLGLAVGVNVHTARGVERDRRPSDDAGVTLGELVDYLMVMSYDYHGRWNYAGHNAPLFPTKGEGDRHSVKDSFLYWTEEHGFALDKVVMGLAFYGRTFSGFRGFGEKAERYSAITYTEVAHRIAAGGWTVFRDETKGEFAGEGLASHRQPYMIKDDEMVSYDDEMSIKLKTRWFRGLGIRGYSIWEIGQDYDGMTNVLLDAARSAW